MVKGGHSGKRNSSGSGAKSVAKEPFFHASPRNPYKGRNNYRGLGHDEKPKYEEGRKTGRILGNRKPYTGMPVYLQHSEDRIISDEYTRNDAIHDMGAADKLVIDGMSDINTGEQLIDAARLYRVAMSGAERIGDYDLQRKVYGRAVDKLSWAREQLLKSDKDRYRGNIATDLKISPMVKLDRLERSLKTLNGDSELIKKVERVAALFFFGISLIVLFLAFSKPLGAVIGTNNEILFGLFAFILWIVGVYFYFRKKR